MPVIHDISRISAYTDAARVSGQGSVQSTPNVTRYGSNQGQQTQVSLTDAYRQHRTELQNLLQRHGFTADQAFQLAQIGHLNVRQFTRAMILAQILMKQAPLFESFVRTLKNITSRGQNVQEGVRTFFDGLDRVLGQDTHRLVDDAAKEPFREGASGATTYAPRGSPAREQSAFEENLAANKSAVRINPTHVPDTLTAQTAQAAREFADFFNASMEGFPTRYPVDAYAAAVLARRGLSLDDYMRLADEVPPLRLVNLLAKAEARGASPQAILNILTAAAQNGEDLTLLLETLEAQYGAHAALPPSPKGEPAFAAFSATPFSATLAPETDSPAPTGPALSEKMGVNFIHTQEGGTRRIGAAPVTVTIASGEKAALEFTAVDAADGALPPEKSAFVVYPGGTEHRGNVLDLSYLPPGMHLILMAGVNSRRKMTNLWMRVRVEEKPGRRDDPDQPDRDDSLPERTRREPASEPKEAVTVSAGSAAEPVAAAFLGEIVLPLDYLARDPAELAVISPETGIVVSPEEYASGTFSHHAVTFRFLANDVESPDLKKRHALLHLKRSEAFEKFDAAVKGFVADPATGLGVFRAAAREFFASLQETFPAGEKSFATARELLIREAEAFAAGESGGELYDAASVEKRGPAFLAACYAKGACALAGAGDFRGALHGFARATLTRLDDPRQTWALGDYLQRLRDLHFARETRDEVRRYYETRLDNAFDEPVSEHAHHADLGRKFIQAADLHRDT